MPLKKPFVKNARQIAVRTPDQLEVIILANTWFESTPALLQNRHSKAAELGAEGFRLLGNQIVQERNRPQNEGSGCA